jgi:hypothetical protein
MSLEFRVYVCRSSCNVTCLSVHQYIQPELTVRCGRVENIESNHCFYHSHEFCRRRPTSCLLRSTHTQHCRVVFQNLHHLMYTTVGYTTGIHEGFYCAVESPCLRLVHLFHQGQEWTIKYRQSSSCVEGCYLEFHQGLCEILHHQIGVTFLYHLQQTRTLDDGHKFEGCQRLTREKQCSENSVQVLDHG